MRNSRKLRDSEDDKKGAQVKTNDSARQQPLVFSIKPVVSYDIRPKNDVSLGPNSTWLVTSRLDTTRHVRRVEPVETNVSSASSCACSNMADMADDEQATVLACTSLVVCALIHAQILFVPSNEIN